MVQNVTQISKRKKGIKNTVNIITESGVILYNDPTNNAEDADGFQMNEVEVATDETLFGDLNSDLDEAGETTNAKGGELGNGTETEILIMDKSNFK